MSDVSEITIELPGAPQGKGRGRAFVAKHGPRAGRIQVITPDATRSYEGMIRQLAAIEMRGRPPIEAPVEVWLTAVFEVPASFSKAKRAAALGNSIHPAKKPDIDNIIKAFTDSANKIIFKDDSQIVRGHYAKIYGDRPRVVMTVKPLA